jgi:adenylate cyclase
VGLYRRQVVGMSQSRRLAAILAADVVGYSRLMGADEEGTLERLKALRGDLIDPNIAKYHGRIVKTTGDGLLVEFASVVDAVRCAAEVQQAMPERNAGVAADRRIELRVGINLGDVIADGDDLYGDGVNIAARIEALADAGGLFVSSTVYEQVRDRLPFGFEDRGEQHVKNIARPVRVYRAILDQAASGPRNAPPSSWKPSIAVLPFQNMSSDPEQEYFADGIVEEIITGLSRIPSLYVIARNSSFAFKGRSSDVRQVGKELGARYVLEGSVRKAAGRVRITGQLIDTDTGAHLWADRFEGELTDIFRLQDQVTISVVGAIEPKIRLAEMERALRKPTENLEAYDLVLRGRWICEQSGKGYNAALHYEAVRLYRGAIALDPNYARAYALLARALWILVGNQWAEPSKVELAEYVNFARAAVRLGRGDPDTLCIAAHIIALPGGQLSEGMEIVDRAMRGNPASAETLAMSGMLRAFAGDTETAFRHLNEADRLGPPGVVVYLKMYAYSLTCFVDGDYAAVLHWTMQTMQIYPDNVVALRYRAAAFGLLGRLDEARATVNQLLALNPELTISRCRRHVEVEMNNPYKRPGVAEAYFEGLRLAGLPE